MTKFLNISTDSTLGGNSPSDDTVSSQKAIKNYVDNSLPTVNNSLITITQGGVTKGSFTLNQGTAATINVDATGSGTEYHPNLFDVKWADHELDDMAWLRSDTFSWQSGSTYSNAYNHLVDDANIHIWGLVYATKKRHPSAGDTVWHGSISTGTVISYDSANDAITISVDGTTSTQGYVQAEPYTSLPVIIETETIAGTTVQFYTANDGHKICTADQESNVAAIYTATGVAWYYILDTVNQRFKLPRSKHNKYAASAPVVGNGLTLGLTNGTKNVGLATRSGQGDGNQHFPNGNAYGISVTATGPSDSDTYGAFGVTTDPANSGIIATLAEDTDQYKYLYFYVGEFTQTAIENTAGLNAELFNGKVDTGHQLIASLEPTANNNYKWYRKYADGWVEQGGISPTNSSTYSTFSLPIPMADTNYIVLATLRANTVTGSGGSWADGYAISTTEIGLVLDYVSTWVGMGCYWMVMGKAA